MVQQTQSHELQQQSGTRHGSNDSSTATLTPSITTIIKYPPMNSTANSACSVSGTPQQMSLHSLNAVTTVTTICGSNGASVVTTASAPCSGRAKRTSKFAPASSDAFSCDPMLFGQERRSTEIIL